MKKGLIKTALMILGFIAINLAITSCEKTEDTKAEVEVLNSDNLAVEGAEVRLFPEATLDTALLENGYKYSEDQFIEYTNANGIATFDFTEYYKPGQSGFAILNVEIIKDLPGGPQIIEGVIKIEEEKTNTKTFTFE